MTETTPRKVQKYDDFLAEMKTRAGENGESKDVKFQCTRCKHVQCGQDFLDIGVENRRDVVFMSCIGRRNTKKGGCDRTLGGLFQIHTKEVETEDGHKTPVFEFYDEPTTPC